MVLVFPLEKSSNDCIELRFALRSMQYLNPDRVILIGYRPGWVKNIIHIPFTQRAGLLNKQFNIFAKLQKAFLLEDEFLYCNDDHFLNPAFDPGVNYFSGYISEMMEKAGKGYKQTINNTLRLTGRDILNYDIHCPIYMRKKEFYYALPMDYFNRPGGALIKSLYALGAGNKKEYPDCKITTSVFDPVKLQERLFFSVSDRGLTRLFIDFLQQRYPIKSKYE